MGTEKIRDAVVIHGPGRSGTTLLNEILSTHSDLAWISGYVNRFPGHPVLTLFNRVMAIDTVERLTRSKHRWPRSAEAYGFWNRFFPRFNHPERRITEKPQDHPEECIAAIRKIQRYHGKKRFLTKLTGGARAGELAIVFENPHIVYMHRDPRAVVASYYKQRWGYKDTPERFKKKTELEHLAKYVKRYESIFEGRDALREFRFSEFLFEDMVDEPDLFFRDLLSKVGLPCEEAFFDRLSSWKMDKTAKESWRSYLSSEGVALLDDSLKKYVDFTTGLQRKVEFVPEDVAILGAVENANVVGASFFSGRGEANEPSSRATPRTEAFPPPGHLAAAPQRVPKPRRGVVLAAVSAAALAVVAWGFVLHPMRLRADQVKNCSHLAFCSRVVEEYAKQKGRYPETLEEALALAGSRASVIPVPNHDVWGNELIYRTDGKTYVIASLGRDGEVDGPDPWDLRTVPVTDPQAEEQRCADFDADSIVVGGDRSRSCCKAD